MANERLLRYSYGKFELETLLGNLDHYRKKCEEAGCDISDIHTRETLNIIEWSAPIEIPNSIIRHAHVVIIYGHLVKDTLWLHARKDG